MLSEMILWNYWGSWTGRGPRSARSDYVDHTAEEEAAFERRMAAARRTDKFRPTPGFVVK